MLSSLVKEKQEEVDDVVQQHGITFDCNIKTCLDSVLRMRRHSLIAAMTLLGGLEPLD